MNLSSVDFFSNAVVRVGLLLRSIPVKAWQWVITIVLLVCLSQLIAQVFWRLIAVPQSLETWDIKTHSLNQAPSPELHRAPFHVKNTHAVDIAQLSQLLVFGDAKSAASAPVAITHRIEDDAADTSLNLTLSGIVSSSRPEDARAIINDGGHQGLYGPQDGIEKLSGVSLVKVLADRVILDNNGRFESLWLYSDEPLPTRQRAASNTRRSNSAAITAVTAPKSRAASGAKAPAVVSSAGSNDAAIRFDQLIKFSLARKGGDVIGYKIRPGKDSALFASLGLKNSDIVTSVNGMVLDSSAKAMEVYQTLRNASRADLELLRDNTPMHLTIDVHRGES